MLRHPLAAAIVLLAHGWAQDMPVTRLAGGGTAPVVSQGAAAPQRPAGSQLPPLPVTQIDPRDAAASLDAQRGLSLTFLEPMPIGEVLRLLVEGTPFSLSIDADAGGTFRGDLKRLTLRQALTALLAPLGLDFEAQGTIIRVMRHRTQTRQYDLNLLDMRRSLQRTASNGGGSAAISTSAGGVSEGAFAGVADGIRSLLSDTGRVHIDARAGLALVSDFPERLDRVGLYVEMLQANRARQVRLEARVFEVTLRGAPSIDWGLVRQKLGAQPGAPEAGMAADPLALRTALAAQGDIQDLWAPEVTTMNNEPAMMHISNPGSSSLTMTVVPQISAEGIVQLSISHAWEEQDGDRKQGLLKPPTPLTRTTGADTVTRVMNGNTVMISGLSRPREIAAVASGMAGVFGASQKQKGRAELVVLLRPTVVTPGSFTAGNRQ
jgi:type II secretory pathway component GspD/PulD (secretin)